MLSDLHPLVIVAYGLGVLLVLYHWSLIAATGVYQYILYPHRLKRRYDTRFLPRCSVIVPCKGVPHNAEENLRAFLRLDYPEYAVVFAVEDDADLAVPLIRGLVDQDGNGGEDLKDIRFIVNYDFPVL